MEDTGNLEIVSSDYKISKEIKESKLFQQKLDFLLKQELILDKKIHKVEIRRKGLTGSGKLGNCHWNVYGLVERFGGEQINGYVVITDYDKHNGETIFTKITFLAHSVWKTKEGKLVDVTLSQDSLEKYCYFIKGMEEIHSIGKFKDLDRRYEYMGNSLEYYFKNKKTKESGNEISQYMNAYFGNQLVLYQVTEHLVDFIRWWQVVVTETRKKDSNFIEDKKEYFRKISNSFFHTYLGFCSYMFCENNKLKQKFKNYSFKLCCRSHSDFYELLKRVLNNHKFGFLKSLFLNFNKVKETEETFRKKYINEILKFAVEKKESKKYFTDTLAGLIVKLLSKKDKEIILEIDDFLRKYIFYMIFTELITTENYLKIKGLSLDKKTTGGDFSNLSTATGKHFEDYGFYKDREKGKGVISKFNSDEIKEKKKSFSKLVRKYWEKKSIKKNKTIEQLLFEKIEKEKEESSGV